MIDITEAFSQDFCVNVCSSGVNLAGTLGYVGADPEGLVEGEKDGTLGRVTTPSQEGGSGLGPLCRKNDFYLLELWVVFLSVSWSEKY